MNTFDIDSGTYDPKLPLVDGAEEWDDFLGFTPAAQSALKTLEAELRAERERLNKQFHADLLEHFGFADHPMKREILFAVDMASRYTLPGEKADDINTRRKHLLAVFQQVADVIPHNLERIFDAIAQSVEEGWKPPPLSKPDEWKAGDMTELLKCFFAA